jgi:hypothetical protein
MIAGETQRRRISALLDPLAEGVERAQQAARLTVTEH